MDFDTTALTWMPSTPGQLAVTLTFDIQNLMEVKGQGHSKRLDNEGH